MSQQPNYQWVRSLRRMCQQHWLPLVVGVVSTLMVLGLWQQLLIQEQSHIEQLAQQEANAIEIKLNRELTTRISALERMASRWEISGGTPESLWEADATNLVEDFYGYQAIEWVDSSFRVRWVVPLKGNEAAQNLDLSQEKRRRITLQVARNLHQTLLTQTISLVQGGKGFLAGVPLFLQQAENMPTTSRFDGFIVGVFRFQPLFDSLIKTSPRYQVQVFDRHGLIYSQGSPTVTTLSKTVQFQAYSLDWQVRVIPTPELIAKERSLFPTVVLWGGVAVAWTLALVVHLRQSSLRQARWTKQINQRLQDEVIHRQQAEASLRTSEERWQLALRGNNDGIWDWNIKTAQVFFSNRWKEMLGYEEHEIGTHLDEWERRVHPDDLAATQAAIANHLARKTPFYISEHRVRCKDGSYKWILDRGQALWDEAGNGLRMVGSHTDITERKQAEIALKESEAKYRNLVGYLNAGIVIHAPDTQILQCNTTACNILGLSMEQLLGREEMPPDWTFLREDGMVMPIEEYPVNRVLATQAAVENYIVGVNQGSQLRVWVLVTAFPEFDDHDQIQQIVVTFIDISQLKQAETDLRDLAAVMENAVSGISKLDAQGRYIYVNKAYAEMTGYKPEEMIGLSWQQTVAADELSQVQQAYLQMLRDDIVEAEAKGIRKDDSCFYKQLVMIAAYDESHQLVGHYCCMKDISDRKQAEEALRHSESTLRSFFNSGVMLMGIVELHENDILHLSANQASASFFGITPEVMKNRFASELGILSVHLQQWINACREAERSQTSVQFEYFRKHQTGGIWLAVSVCQIASSSGQLPRFSYIVENITDRKQTKLALEKELMQSQTLFNTSIDGIVVLNHDGDVVQTSLSFAQMIGYTLEETLKLNVSDWDAQWTREELQEIRERTVVPPVFETRHRRKDGSIYDVEISCNRVKLDSEILHFCICRDITERKQTEIALQNSQARFAGILEIANDAIISVNANQQIILFNKGAERIFGYQAEEILGQPLSLLMPDRVKQIHLEHMKQYAQSAGNARPMARRGMIVGQRKDGTEFPAEASISKLNLNGDVTYTTFLRDISARQQAEAAMSHLAAIVESSEDAIISTSLEGTIVSWNTGAETIFGYTAEEIIGQPVTQLLPEGSLGEKNVILGRIQQGESVHPYDTQRKRKDGTLVALSISISPIKDVNGNIIGSSKIARDISDRKHIEAERQRAEENLRHQKEMLQAIVNHIPVMIALFNSDGRVEYVNPELIRVLGWTLEDWQQRDVLAECYPNPADYQRVIAHILSVDGQWEDFTTLTKSHQKIETSWTNIALSNGSNLGIGQDISDRKSKEIILRKAMEAAEAASTAKSMFLANMSHELRTPLNVILGFTQVLAHDESLTSNQQEDLQTIQRSGDHLLSLINEILDLSKIEAGHCTLEETEFDLISLLHELRKMMTERARTKQIQLRFEIAPEVPQFIVADEQKLRQILLNLLSNAIKFTHQGNVTLQVNLAREKSKIGVAKSAHNREGADPASPPRYPASSAQTPMSLQFEVIDTGVGIADTELDTIFDAFAQAEAGKKSVSGTGLGLTISRKLLELMQGQIIVQSTPNVGSTFTVVLPVSLTSRESYPQPYNHAVIGLVPNQARRRILVVDDQRENRLVMLRLLSILELEVREARDGYDAVEIWREWQPDLIWMDIRMPGLDGYEATQQIRAMEQEKTTVIIALTAQTSQSDRALALAVGCNDYISKPFQKDTIFHKMAEYLGLEYLYADSELPLPLPLEELQVADAASLVPPDPGMLIDLPSEWLRALEEAAVCGNDRKIIELTTHLAAEFTPLKLYLMELANQFEFEQIVRFIYRCYSA